MVTLPLRASSLTVSFGTEIHLQTVLGDDVGVEPLQYKRLRHGIVVAGLESGEKSFGCLG